MMNEDSISRLYETALFHEINQNCLSNSEIRAGIQSLGHVYRPETLDFDSSTVQFPDFNDPACRCAYLHKYAPLHTYMVQDAMLKILRVEPGLFRTLLSNQNGLKFCSLGGGPGSDVIGVLAALRAVFGSFFTSVTVIDCMVDWENTFSTVMCKVALESCGTIWDNCQWNYVGFNLLCSMSNEVNKSIASASFITMIKFISATTCKDTEIMVDKIFRVMKPGALLLYIDNAAGGFTQLIERSGRRNGLFPVIGPWRHVQYENEALQVDRFGYSSCYKTKVTVILMKKQFKGKDRDAYTNDNAPPEKPLSSVDFIVLGNNSSQEQSDTDSTNINLLSTSQANSNISWKHINDYPEKLKPVNDYPERLNDVSDYPEKLNNLKRSLVKPSNNQGNTRNVRNEQPRPQRLVNQSARTANNYVQPQTVKKMDENQERLLVKPSNNQRNTRNLRNEQPRPERHGNQSARVANNYVQPQTAEEMDQEDPCCCCVVS